MPYNYNTYIYNHFRPVGLSEHFNFIAEEPRIIVTFHVQVRSNHRFQSQQDFLRNADRDAPCCVETERDKQASACLGLLRGTCQFP